MAFFLNFESPVAQSSFKIKELSFKQFRELNKYILTDKNEFIEHYINTLIFENLENKNDFFKLTNFDKFCCMLLLRSVCVSPDLEIFQKKQNVKVSITDFLTKCLNFKHKFTKTIIQPDIEIALGLPNNFCIQTFLDLPLLVIKQVKIQNTTYLFNEIDETVKSDLVESLPGNILFEIKTHFEETINLFKELELQIPSFNEPVVLNPYDSTLLELIKLIFRANLSNIYEMQYILVSKLHYSPHYLDENTFTENLLIVRLFEDEIKKQEELHKKSKSPSVPINPGKT